MTRIPSRRRRAAVGLLAATASLAMLAGCAAEPAESGDGDLQTVRFALNWVPDVEWAAYYIADSEGYFADAGVKAEFVHGGPNTPGVAQVVAAGQADIGVASDELQLVQANAEGADYVVIGAMYYASPSAYTWMSSTDIESAEDLVGLNIGGIQGDQIRIDAIFELNGLPVDYTFVPMGYDPQPLVAGEVDVITSYISNQPIQLRQAGEDVTSKTFTDFGLSAYGDVIFASRAYLEENPDLVAAALSALIKGAQKNIDDPELGVSLTVDAYAVDSGLDAEFATEANAAYIALIQNDFTDTAGILSVDPEYMANNVFVSYEAAGETGLPPVDEFVDTSYMIAAHKLLAG
jgi:ABC-type nitrate/sulfonate/bicarbonate transport system substrate-binding protein